MQTAVEFLIERYKENGNQLTEQDFDTARKIETLDQVAHFESGVSEYDRLFGPNPKPNEYEKD